MRKLPLICLMVWGLATAVLPGAMAGTLTLNSNRTTVADGASVSLDLGSSGGGKDRLANLAGNTLVNVADGSTYTLVTGLGGSTGPFSTITSGTGLVATLRYSKPARLSGTADKLKIASLDDGNTLRIKTKVSITNSGGPAKNVTATVYLSDDAVLDTAKDTKLKTLKLSDYFPAVIKLKKGQTLSLPIKHKVPAAIASFLEGKYLIAVLNADAPSYTVVFNGSTYHPVSGSTAGTVPATTIPVIPSDNRVVIGPIHLPTSD